jgi:hypothetical protein
MQNSIRLAASAYYSGDPAFVASGPQPRIGRRERLVSGLLHTVESHRANRRKDDGREACDEKCFHGNPSPLR